jgi:hypothetical protein
MAPVPLSDDGSFGAADHSPRPVETLALRLEHCLADGTSEALRSINREAQKRQASPFLGPVIMRGPKSVV